jgi:hypothetical protein
VWSSQSEDIKLVQNSFSLINIVVGSNPTQPQKSKTLSNFGTDTLDGESGGIPHHNPDGGSWNASAD